MSELSHVQGKRATMVNVDEEGRPLRPAIVWLDQRRTEGLPPVGGLWGLAFRLVNMRRTVAYFQAEAEANGDHLNMVRMVSVDDDVESVF